MAYDGADPSFDRLRRLTLPRNFFFNITSTSTYGRRLESPIMAQETVIAVPGQLLGPMSEFLPGPGTHIRNSKLYASILGPITTSVPAKPPGPQKRLTKITPAAPTPLKTISVERDMAAASGGAKARAEVLPEVNSTVLCRVTRITPKQASVAILVVGDTVLDGEWQGIIRVQDVRATEKDRVKIFDSFRPGDIVRAVVVSLLLATDREALLTISADFTR